MIIACVYVHVKPDNREAFIAACLDNARNTVQEPGNLRFDVLQQADDPNRFMLYEVYRDDAGAKAHKATAHYARWAETVKDWMADTRFNVKYTPLFPEKAGQWSTIGARD
jgi:(4S)-4-hydroxy-5-phosphonooxypentane-2,3-dione isomerase